MQPIEQMHALFCFSNIKIKKKEKKLQLDLGIIENDVKSFSLELEIHMVK